MTALMILTFVTGLVDAVSFLRLGHVFTANMTGNVVFLGFALAGAQDLSPARSLASLAAFLAGAIAGGKLGKRLTVAASAEAVLLSASAIIAFAVPSATAVAYAVIVLTALAMGLRNASVRALGVPDMTTTVLTLTLTGIASDSSLAGGTSPRLGRRLGAVVLMFAGACAGAVLVHWNIGTALAVGAALAAIAALASGKALEVG